MSFLSLRSRLLQTLILALVGLTFYTYYRTTASELQQYAFVRSYSECDDHISVVTFLPFAYVHSSIVREREREREIEVDCGYKQSWIGLRWKPFFALAWREGERVKELCSGCQECLWCVVLSVIGLLFVVFGWVGFIASRFRRYLLFYQVYWCEW